MLLELAVLGLIGYGMIKAPDKTTEKIHQAADKAQQFIARHEQEFERKYQRGEISEEQYRAYWDRKNSY